MADDKKRDPLDAAGMVGNAILMGVGMLDMTREKAGTLADDLIERGKVSKSDAKEVAEKITEVAEKQQDVLRSTVAKETDRAMKTAGVATKVDVDALHKEIADLKAMIAGMAGKDAPSAD